MFEFDSMGSRFWIEPLDGHIITSDIKDRIISYCERFDNTYSRFKDDSLIAQLAHKGTIHTPPHELIVMLDFAKEIYDASGGAFNITVGATLHALGYGDTKHGRNLLSDPWQAVTWDSKHVTVPKGLMLDLGGFGKGWMIDHIAEILEESGIKQYIVNGGGDLRVKNSKELDFTLEDPFNPSYALQTVALKDGAIGASDTFKRSWEHNGANKHHIIDPRTADSSNTGIAASFVVAPTALIADTMATVVILRPDLRQDLAERYAFTAKLLAAPKATS